MKKNSQFVMVLALLLGVASSVQAAVAFPAVQDNGTTEGVGSFNATPSMVRVMSVGGVTFMALPSYGPLQSSTNFAAYAANGVASIETTGTLPTGSRTSATDARLLQRITPDDLMSWSNGDGGTVWWWIVSIANQGGTISLANVSVTLSSSEPGNILGKTVSFSGANVGYGPLSPGIPADGSTAVTSGPATQQIAGRVIVAVGSKSFTVTSASDVQSIRDWVNQFQAWRTTCVVTAQGASASFSLSKGQPKLTALRSGNRLQLVAEANGDPMSYGVQSSPSLGSSAVWSYAGTIKAGQTNNEVVIIPTTGAIFFRFAPILVAQ